MKHYFRNAVNHKWHVAYPPDAWNYFNSGRFVSLCWKYQSIDDMDAEKRGNSITKRPSYETMCKTCLRLEGREKTLDEKRREYIEKNREWMERMDQKTLDEFNLFLITLGPPDIAEKELNDASPS